MKAVEEFVKKEMVKDIINNLYGIKMTDNEIKYCKADVQATIDVYRRKVEENMKRDIKRFFKSTCRAENEVLFVLFKDGTHNYYDLTGHRVEAHDVCLYIESPVFGHFEKIAYAAIEDWAIGIKNPDESALSAIPDWFEERIKDYTDTLKEETEMTNRWDLYYTRTNYGQDRVIIAKTLDEAKEYAAKCYEGCSKPIWLAEADKYDIDSRVNVNGASTLWASRTDTRLNVPGIIKYADAIAWLKYKLGIAVEPKKTGAIEVRYEDGHIRVFDDVEKYEENYSVLGVHQLCITKASGGPVRIPLVWIKEYVVDMPNDKKLVKEKITVSREEMADIVAKMRELEERLKKIQEG